MKKILRALLVISVLYIPHAWAMSKRKGDSQSGQEAKKSKAEPTAWRAGVKVNPNSSALINAVAQGNKEMVQFLLENGAEVYFDVIYEAFHLDDDLTMVQLLISKISKPILVPQLTASNYGSLLGLFAAMNEVEMAERATEQCIELNINTDECSSSRPLMIASILGNLDVVRMLLKYGATVQSDDFMGGTNELEEAIRHNHLEVAKELMAHGATLSSENRGKLVKSAIEKGHQEMARILLENEQLSTLSSLLLQ